MPVGVTAHRRKVFPIWKLVPQNDTGPLNITGFWMAFSKVLNHVCGSIGGGGQEVRTPLENYKNKGFLSNTAPDPLKITKLPSQHSMLGHHQPASKTPFKCRFAGGLLMAN